MIRSFVKVLAKALDMETNPAIAPSVIATSRPVRGTFRKSACRIVSKSLGLASPVQLIHANDSAPVQLQSNPSGPVVYDESFARPELYHADSGYSSYANSVSSQVLPSPKPEDKQTTAESTTYINHIRNHCPHLHGPNAVYHRSPSIIHPLLNWTASVRKPLEAPKIHYERMWLQVTEPAGYESFSGLLSLDFTPSIEVQKTFSEEPLIICLPHIGGHSNSYNIRELMGALCGPKGSGGRGYRGVVLNHRAHGSTPLTSPRIPNLYDTEDQRAALLHLRRMFPVAKFIVIGLSMGGALLTKLLSEQGAGTTIHAALAMSPVLSGENFSLDLERISNAPLMARFVPKLVSASVSLMKPYSYVFNGDARLSFEDVDEGIDSLVKMDDFHNRFAKVYGGFRDRDQFYEAASCLDDMKNIAIPMMVMWAKDDIKGSVSCAEHLMAENPNIIQAVTEHGGHIGFVTGVGKRKRRWSTKPICEWVDAVLALQRQPVLAETKHRDGRDIEVWEITQEQVETLVAFQVRTMAKAGTPMPSVGLKK
ncbi:hypothetical protein YB2330_004377 [Saitoella coloradoensis]